MSQTFDESGRPIKGAQRAGNRARHVGDLGQTSDTTDYTDFGLTPQAAASGWGSDSTGSSVSTNPPTTVLPTVTISSSTPSNAIPWWAYLLGAVAIGYILGHMFHGRVQKALSSAASY